MLRFAVFCLVIALIAGFLGFGLGPNSWEGARLVCLATLTMAVLAFMASTFRKRSSWD